MCENQLNKFIFFFVLFVVVHKFMLQFFIFVPKNNIEQRNSISSGFCLIFSTIESCIAANGATIVYFWMSSFNLILSEFQCYFHVINWNAARDSQGLFFYSWRLVVFVFVFAPLQDNNIDEYHMYFMNCTQSPFSYNSRKYI